MLHTQITIHLPAYISIPLSLYTDRGNDYNMKTVWGLLKNDYHLERH